VNATICLATLLVLFASARAAPKIVRPPVALPQAVLAPPDTEADALLQAAPARSSPQALEARGGPWALRPWELHPGLYDHRYITW
jgi:hypothetical protein